MIKVLMVGNHPSNKGGMTSVIRQIRDYDWNKKGIDLYFVPTFIPGNPFRKIVFFVCSYLQIFVQFIFAKPDIVHMHMSYKGSFSRKYLIHKLCKVFKIKDIIHLHGSEFEKWYSEVSNRKKIQVRNLLSECDSFIVLGNGWKDVIKKIEPSTKVSVISNGIPIPNEMVHWNNDRCQVLFLGVLIPRKGVSDLIKAISLIKEQNKINKLHFVIAGTGEDEEKLKKQVTDLNLDNYVSFIGWVAGNKKKDLILNSQIFVLPSYNEGLPISILEAASYGMPVVSTNVGDIDMVVQDGINGFLIMPGDINTLAEKIESIVSEELYESMSCVSRKIAEEHFSESIFISKIIDLYNKIFLDRIRE